MSKLELTMYEKAALRMSLERILATPDMKGLVFICAGIVEGGAHASVSIIRPETTDGQIAEYVMEALARAMKESEGVSREEASAKARGGVKWQ